MLKKNNNEKKSTAHSKYRCQYHIVFAPKYRHKEIYVLTGIIFCGECGAKYRRVTWARNGKKRIVWRCIERLENGIRNCKDSPTIYEDKLKDAIMSGLSQITLDISDIAEMVKSEIWTVIHKNDDQNEYTIKSKINKLEKEIKVLVEPKKKLELKKEC